MQYLTDYMIFALPQPAEKPTGTPTETLADLVRNHAQAPSSLASAEDYPISTLGARNMGVM